MSSSRFNKSTKVAALIAGALLMGFTGIERDPLAPVTVSHSYHPTDYGAIEVLGVCNVTANSVDCWDTDGKREKGLTKKLEGFYGEHPNSNLYFKVGKKTRVLVIRRPTASLRTPDLTLSVPATGLRMLNGGFPLILNLAEGGGQGSGPGHSSFVDSLDKLDSEEQWYTVYAQPEEKEMALEFPILVAFDQVTLPLKVGGEGKIGPMHLQINGIRSAGFQLQGNPGAQVHQRTWYVSISIQGYPGAAIPNLVGSPTDLKGEEIQRAELRLCPNEWCKSPGIFGL